MSRPAATRLPNCLPAAVVFDLDGLMLDSERVLYEVWRRALSSRGFDLPAALYQSLIGLREDASERRIRAHYGTGFPFEELRAEALSLWQSRISTEGVPQKPGLLELLDYLADERIPLAVASSTARGPALARLGAIASRFRAFAFGNEVQCGKPAPDLYLLAAERLNVAARDCLALEDSPPGVAAAEAAGMPVIMIPDLVAPPSPPRYICTSLNEVTEWLRDAGRRR